MKLFSYFFFILLNILQNNIYSKINENNYDSLTSHAIQSIYIYNFSILPVNRNHHKVLFLIQSRVTHYKKREKIRNTWLKLCYRISCLYYFVVATRGFINRVRKEIGENIIGIDVIDNYYNLTILTANMYKYLVVNKFQYDFVVKNDDDIYPNIPIIILYINIYIQKRMVSGYYYPEMKASRSNKSSVYLPKYLYSDETFPEFVAGGFVIININLMLLFYKQLQKEKRIIYREDMHMALIYKKIKIKFQKLNKYYHRKSNYDSQKNKLNDICYHGY